MPDTAPILRDGTLCSARRRLNEENVPEITYVAPYVLPPPLASTAFVTWPCSLALARALFAAVMGSLWSSCWLAVRDPLYRTLGPWWHFNPSPSPVQPRSLCWPGPGHSLCSAFAYTPPTAPSPPMPPVPPMPLLPRITCWHHLTSDGGAGSVVAVGPGLALA
jgi:hypothetical protein